MPSRKAPRSERCRAIETNAWRYLAVAVAKLSDTAWSCGAVASNTRTISPNSSRICRQEAATSWTMASGSFISSMLPAVAATIGENIRVRRFVRFEVGEEL